MSSKKATRKGDIPVKILKSSFNVYLSELTLLTKNCLKKGVFPSDLKVAVITPIFKKEDSLNKENYRPDLLAYYLIGQKCLKGLYTNKLIVLWKGFHITYVALEKITLCNTCF